MKSKKNILKLLLLSLGIIYMMGCTSYLENPLIDKETGEDINLLVIDASVFPVRLQISLIDSISGTAILAPATISFSGKNQDDIITLSGKKQSEFKTSNGFIELALDPNIPVSENEQLIFTIHAVTANRQDITRKFSFESPGIKEIKLHF